MNPLEMIDIRQRQMLNGINDGGFYKSEDVKEFITKAFAFAKQAYMSGDFIFELESFDNETLTVDNTTYKVSKLLGDEDKYTMIVQMLNVPEGDMTVSDMEQLSNTLKKVVHKNPHINGVLLLPSNYDITLMTAKLNTSDYEMPHVFSEEDLKWILENNKQDFLKNVIEGSSRHNFTKTLESVYNEWSTANPFWEEE